MVEAYYEGCHHWGFPLVETPCAKGGRLKSGCSDNTTVGPINIEGRCPACRNRGSVSAAEGGLSQCHRELSQISESPSPASLVETKQREQRTSIAQEQTERYLQITHRTASGRVKPLTRRALEKKPLTVAKQAGIKAKTAILLLPFEWVIFFTNRCRSALDRTWKDD
jgi:hypothetical protein